MKAMWNGEVIAQSNDTLVVENNHYFPISDVKQEYLLPSEHSSTCFWKGKASYYTLQVNGKDNPNAAWYYASPKEKAAHIKGYVAFWKGVEISE